MEAPTCTIATFASRNFTNIEVSIAIEHTINCTGFDSAKHPSHLYITKFFDAIILSNSAPTTTSPCSLSNTEQHRRTILFTRTRSVRSCDMAVPEVADQYLTLESRVASFQTAQPLSKRRASNASSKAPKSLKWPHKFMSVEEVCISNDAVVGCSLTRV